MDNKIKSYDLCERCTHYYCNDACSGKHGVCSLQTDDPPGCKCITVKLNTPCPYFADKDEMG